MADVKREVSALGQKIVGLKAGDKVTLVLKRPKPKVDAENAKRASRIARDQMAKAKQGIQSLLRAKQSAENGDSASGNKLVDEARSIWDSMKGAAEDAKDFVKRATDDTKSAVAEVKEAYQAAQDCADLSAQHIEKVAEGFGEALRAVGALVEEASSR